MKPFNPTYLVVSLGNPLPKYASLHSAGHYVLAGLSRILPGHETSVADAEGRLPTSRLGGGDLGCPLSRGHQYTLAQSPLLMNISGQFVASALRSQVKARQPLQSVAPRTPQHRHQLMCLVLVHDELEMALGTAATVAWDRSARGHRGVKSVQAALRQAAFPTVSFVRVAVGIGRPESRESDAVSEYVLRRIMASERTVLEKEVPWVVKRAIEAHEAEWLERRKASGE